MNNPDSSNSGTINEYKCSICDFSTNTPAEEDCGAIRGNTEAFLSQQFRLWRCSQCQTIFSVDPIDIAEIYADYPLNNRTFDVFAKVTLGNLLKRLVVNGLTTEMRILDFGCGNGLFVDFLKRKGYTQVTGYDPFVSQYCDTLKQSATFDMIIANDVIEHSDDPREVLQECLRYLKPSGMLYVGTADSLGVEDLRDLEKHIMRLHQPFHRLLISNKTLLSLGQELDLSLIANYQRSYMDTISPFANYRFLDEINRALNHNMDRALSPEAPKAVMTSPRLLFFGLFGYFCPSAVEPAALWRKP